MEGAKELRCTEGKTREFIPQLHQQRVMTEFLKTNHRGLGLIHYLGTGKCLDGETKVWTSKGKVKIASLWELAGKIIDESDKEEWKLLDQSIQVSAMKEEKYITQDVSRIFRQQIQEQICILKIDDSTIKCTARHAFYTPSGFISAGQLTCSDKIGYFKEQDGTFQLKWKTIEKITVCIRDGYVYDIEVPDVHNYLIEDGLITHNTCSAFLIVDELLKLPDNLNKHVFIFAPAALASSFQSEYCTFCGQHPDKLEKQFHFFSYNDRAGIASKVERLNLDDSIILVDEVQEIVNGKRRNSGSLTAVYDKIFTAKRARVILLSGTPIYEPIGISYYLNLLEPGILPLDEEDFELYMRKPNYLFPVLEGLISVVPSPNPEFFPERLSPDIVETIPMSEPQYLKYAEVRKKELQDMGVQQHQIEAARKRGNQAMFNKLKAIKFIQSTSLLSRQICNFYYPEDIAAKIDADIYKSDRNAAWIQNDPDPLGNLAIYSPKFKRVLENILRVPASQKQMVYGFFKELYGLLLFQAYLDRLGISNLIFSGDLSTDKARGEVLQKWNADDNAYGQKYRVVLVSGAGSVGISLFGIRHCHIIEAGINEFITDQAIGRAFRTKGHFQLKPEERNVQVYRYFSSIPKNHLEEGKYSSEEITYQRGMRKKKETEDILSIVRRAAFDCGEKYNQAKCYDYTNNDPIAIPVYKSIRKSKPFRESDQIDQNEQIFETGLEPEKIEE